MVVVVGVQALWTPPHTHTHTYTPFVKVRKYLVKHGNDREEVIFVELVGGGRRRDAQDVVAVVQLSPVISLCVCVWA